MSRLQLLRRRQDFFQAVGVLVVVRDTPVAPLAVSGQPAATPGNPAEGPEILLSVWDDGRVVALHGHVDLGTGIRTAFAQIVAQELDVGMDQVDVILGDTGMAPNQGPTGQYPTPNCLRGSISDSHLTRPCRSNAYRTTPSSGSQCRGSISRAK